jgi:hypothetical protein
MKSLSQDGRCPGRESTEHDSRALPLCYPLGKEFGVSVAQSTLIRKVLGLNLNLFINYFG